MIAEVQLAHAGVALGGRAILHDVSLRVGPGQCIAVIGANGAGKSTLLRAMAGLVPLADGAATLCGDAPAQLTPRARALRAAYLPQARPLAWGISVEAMVGLGRFAAGPDPKVVTEALAACGIEGLRHRRADQLSGGEVARAHIARALASRAPVLIADEPTAALDPRHAFQVMQLLAAHAAKGGAVVAALHDLSLAARFCHRITVLAEGRIIAEGTPDQALTPQALRQAFGVEAEIGAFGDGRALIVHAIA